MFSETLSNRRRQLGFSTAQASRVLRLKEDVLVDSVEDLEAIKAFEAQDREGV